MTGVGKSDPRAERSTADDGTTVSDVSGAAGPAAWAPVATDPALSSPVGSGGPSATPAGEDLSLSMGWDRFEKLVLALFRRELGARDIKFRRYGTPGQEQHGSDLAGRDPQGAYVVVQCKEYKAFKAADLRAAVDTFTRGRRPFDSRSFIVVTSAPTQATRLAEELAALQDAHSDLELDLWGAEVINEHLRNFADIVTRFWTRETAAAFCSGAPHPGVPAPPPDRQVQAERILLGPLNTSDVAPVLREAEARRDEPATAASLYGEVAERLRSAGFRGHALVLRRRQLDVLAEANLADEASALAAELAVAALMLGERDDARTLLRVMTDLDARGNEGQAEDETSDSADGGDDGEDKDENEFKDDGATSARRRHLQLVDAAVTDTMRVVGSPVALKEALRPVIGVADPAYHPSLVLYLAEDLLATEPTRVAEVSELIDAAVNAEELSDPTSQVLLRLRLVRAEYDEAERRALAKDARRHLVPKRAAALIRAREARRSAVDGRAEEAMEAWRDAVDDAIVSDLPDDAADWLYAIRSVNVRYGPWTSELDDEHRLAQALRSSSSGRILERSRDPRDAAMAALVARKPIESLLTARRWLIDARLTGSWAAESDAAEFLAGLYAENREPALAATYFHRAGARKRLDELSAQVGDLLLPLTSWKTEPWWVVAAQVSQAAIQEDLLDDATASRFLDDLIGLARLGRAGELIDSPTHALTIQVAKAACRFASRGTPEQAMAVLDMLESEIAREPNRYFATDDEHAASCVAIALAHPTLTNVAVNRLIDLASYDVQAAQRALVDPEVVALLTGRDDDGVLGTRSADRLTPAERAAARARIVDLADRGKYLADIALEKVDPGNPTVMERAMLAKDRLLARPAPDPGRFEFGTSMVRDSYLASLLPPEDGSVCLDKLMAVASDRREAASNRQDALTGARNLVIGQDVTTRSAVFEQARPFVTGERDGSALDELTGEPHPLSAARISTGSPSLRGDGLKLAQAAADSMTEHEWVCEQALELLQRGDGRDVAVAAVVITRLPEDVARGVDVGALSSSERGVVRQAAAVLAGRDPQRHRSTVIRMCSDPEHRVRVLLAELIALAGKPTPEDLGEARDLLARDPRHSVRSALGSR